MTRFIVALFGLSLLSGAAAASAGSSVEYSVSGKPYEGYYVAPGHALESGARSPLVLLLHDWDGLTDYEVKRADMLAEMGYAVFAADLFGKGIRPTEMKDKKQHTGELYKDREKMRALMDAALEKAWALGGDSERTVAMGYCFGGAAVLELARAGAEVEGFVSFHGGLATPEDQDYSRTAAPVRVFHGTADRIIPMAQFADLADALESAGVDHRMTTYGGARHAFTVFGSDRYQEEADQDSWARFSEFLAERVGLQGLPGEAPGP